MFFCLIIILVYSVHTILANVTATAAANVSSLYDNKCLSMACPPNSVCVECANPCQPSCDNPKREQPCDGKNCETVCVCDSNYLSDDNNRCVPITECKSKSLVSIIIEPIKSFLQVILSSYRPVNDVAYRNEVTAGSTRSETKCTGVNEMFWYCGSCVGTCERPLKICPKICRYPGNCDCRTGYVRNTRDNNQCVAEEEASCALQRNGTGIQMETNAIN